MVNGFCISVLSDGHNSVDSAISGGVTIIFGIVRAISAADGATITAGLAGVSGDVDGVFLLWAWMVLVFPFV